jgi:hypothetical protein
VTTDPKKLLLKVQALPNGPSEVALAFAENWARQYGQPYVGADRIEELALAFQAGWMARGGE